MENKAYIAEFIGAFLKLENNFKVGGIFSGEICSIASSTIHSLANGVALLRKALELGDVRPWIGERGVIRHLPQVKRARVTHSMELIFIRT